MIPWKKSKSMHNKHPATRRVFLRISYDTAANGTDWVLKSKEQDVMLYL